MQDLNSKIKNLALDLGADLVGFSNLEKSPIKTNENLINAVTIAVKLPDAVLQTVIERPTIAYFHEYRSANALLDSISFRIARLIEKEGFLSFPIAASQSLPESDYASLFSHKHAARKAGLGFIGKSGLFISREYGSKIRLATILTNAPIKPESEEIESGCGNCMVCVNKCPAGAISGKNYAVGMERDEIFSAEKCSHYMKTFKDVGRGAVCGICIKNCPYNKLI